MPIHHPHHPHQPNQPHTHHSLLPGVCVWVKPPFACQFPLPKWYFVYSLGPHIWSETCFFNRYVLSKLVPGWFRLGFRAGNQPESHSVPGFVFLAPWRVAGPWMGLGGLCSKEWSPGHPEMVYKKTRNNRGTNSAPTNYRNLINHGDLHAKNRIAPSFFAPLKLNGLRLKTDLLVFSAHLLLRHSSQGRE